MSEDTKDTQETIQSIDELEKSWEDAKSNVLALLGEAPESNEPVEKSESETESVEETVDEVEKAKSGDDGKMEYNEEEDDEDEEEEVSKSDDDSIESDLEKSGDDVALAMDAEPFLRELVAGIDKRFTAVEKSITKVVAAIGNTQELQKATAQMLASYGDLTKATADTVEKIGNTPVPSGSVINGRTERFEKAQGVDGEELNKSQILDKSLKLVQAGKMQGHMLTKIEGRLNKGMSLSEDMLSALKQTVKEEV